MNQFLLKSISENPKPVYSTHSGQTLSHAEGFTNPKWLGLSVIAFVILVVGNVAQAQQPQKVPRIGYLSVLDASAESSRAEAIRLAMREIGYVEGQNIAIEYRYAEGKRERFPELAAELVRLKVDIILATLERANQVIK